MLLEGLARGRRRRLQGGVDKLREGVAASRMKVRGRRGLRCCWRLLVMVLVLVAAVMMLFVSVLAAADRNDMLDSD